MAADSLGPPTSHAAHVSSIATTANENNSTKSGATGDMDKYPIGSIVWGKLPGYDWWPGLIISYCKDKEGDTVGEGEGGGMQVWVKWYGENNLSQVSCCISAHRGWPMY